ncbi:protein held out wings [Lucilia sericata]|uniref:protein held out wings n=1 Tax=Lucilia sericata TaxID=13632 RepID=UPI0018A7F755|nr:protein held out wings [Lucilia sericata]XP_037806061.1 protein held out wings [Lucilia sericata]XP_037806062.1 protein held out wings [Lucilia sericata]XP_037806063.1 protein held out wings [Lucilia sericata]XP_037806064.1 protein held out wings [Lucilia sericata]XP_037806065.1 protein held out wings [Lucilia sericata]XP_037806066.1 protein held out wings [Lucilia sericata]XP_037806067.1 protein held out wings [Lucilia sericata]XP_037806068.1 protein held out wings [Lucilia sericata]
MDVILKANQMDTPEEQRSPKGLEKSKMLDITRDRPVKVAVKVAVPVRDHPKFNFVGKLLGPKGNSMKRLQEETMCKMAVLGRGSMRDRKKEEELRASGDSRYAHLFDDLHVEISTFAAPAEAHARIAYALAEVRRFLVPDYHDDIRHEQMWEMQALTSSTTLQNSGSDQASPTRIIEGGITDMDTSNDEKSDNELSVMDCMTPGKMEKTHNSSNPNAVTPNSTDPLKIPPTSAASLHPCTMAVTLQHQFSAAGIGGLLKPTPTVAAVTGLTPAQPTTTLSLPNEADASATSALTLLDSAGTLLHPALRNIKTINIAGNLTRKRPLLGVPRSSMNPTKRTVMTLLARAKNSQALHTVRNPVGAAQPAPFTDPLQMLASPFIIPHHHHHQPMDQAMLALSKESLAQGV